MSPARPPTDAGSLVVEREAFFIALERRRTHALVTRDMATIEALHAPEYELITPGGRVFSRAEYLAAIEQAPFYAGWEIGRMSFRFGADTTALRYQATLLFPSGRTVHCWHTDLYQEHQGQWQAVWSQATELRPPPSEPPP
jgi:hypothetical protein